MVKSILAKLLVVLLVLVLGHSVFWFFKTGQLEKNINNFVAQNSANVAIGSIKVFGYPFSQHVIIEDLRFSIPNSALNKNKISVQKLEFSSGIFNNNFTVSLIGDVFVKDENQNSRKVEFNQAPRIFFSIIDGEIAKLSYDDSGYRIFDEEGNVAYGALSTSVGVDSKINDVGEIISNINVKIREIEGFGVLDVYKNSFEKKIVDGIKTGSITIGSRGNLQAEGDEVYAASMSQDQDVAASQDVASDAAVAVVNQDAKKIENDAVADVALEAPKPTEMKVEETVVKKDEIASSSVVVAQNSAVVAPKPIAVSASNSDVAKSQDIETKTDDAMKTADLPAVDQQKNAAMPAEGEVVGDKENMADLKDQTIDQIEQALEQSKVIKSDLVMNIRYVLTPNKIGENSTVLLDPSQLQVVATQYSRSFKIDVVEFSNSLYKISLNGQLDYFQDDNLPSGFLTAKIENIDNFVAQIKEMLRDLAKKENAKIQSFDASTMGEVSPDAYKNFLNQVANNLSDVVVELSAKNQLGEGNVSVFEMRREKNLDFVINDTSFRELFGKF